MAYLPYGNGGELPNLVNVTKRLDPDGSIAKIAELLTEVNPMIGDVPMVEGNLPTGHRTTVRTGIPSPTWRMLNYGVQPTKSATSQVDDTIGMCEMYSEVDKDLAMLNGNTAEFRMSEDTPHLEGMSNEMASTVLYGDTAVNPERFHGIMPRYDVIGTPAGKPTAQTNSDYLKHVIDAGGLVGATGALTSMLYVNWGENTVHGIYPKGSVAGLQHKDLGEQTLMDDNGGRFQGFRSHYQWKMGLCVRDWRHIVRIANIDLALLLDTPTEANQDLLYQAMIRAMYTVPAIGQTKGVFYASAAVYAALDIAAVEKGNAALGWTEVYGMGMMLTFRGIPIRQTDAMLESEAFIS